MLTIEVIEDDAAMRTLLTEWLRDDGYRVRSRSGMGASVVDGVDLLVIDLLDLPGQGTTTVDRARKLYPKAAVIGISTQLSRTLAPDSSQARALSVDRLVSKPCSRWELLDAVVDTIGAAT